MVRLTDHAYNCLYKAAEMFLEEIRLHPELYNAYAGRRVTISDVVSILCEGKVT